MSALTGDRATLQDIVRHCTLMLDAAAELHLTGLAEEEFRTIKVLAENALNRLF